MVAAAIAGAAVVGAGASLFGSNKAASSAKDASNIQQQQYQTTRADLQPYFQPGYNALTAAGSLASSGPTGGGPDYVAQAAANLPGNMTQADLEKTPGYQFTLNQGLASVRARNASRGLGMSTASLKGAAEYATGLADKTYLDQFNVQQNELRGYAQFEHRPAKQPHRPVQQVEGVATLGENAAAGLARSAKTPRTRRRSISTPPASIRRRGPERHQRAQQRGEQLRAYNAYTQRTGGYSTTPQAASGQNYGQAA